uniref:Aldehyde ferredoxin oxidoreductase n=1 Tax=Ignisphaera aggregans TaxID=334771 RepID=A0A7C4FF11_9CREN
MLKYTVLRLNVSTKKWSLSSYSIGEVLGPIDIGIKIHNEMESWSRDVFDPANALIIGSGTFAGSKLFGTHRLVTVFRSPETGGIHVSEMGGAAYRFIGCGVNAISIEGRSEEPAIVFVKGDEKGVREVSIENIDRTKLNEIYKGYGGYIGAYALEKYLVDVYWSTVSALKARPIVVGPAALKTVYGALVSIDIDFVRKRFIEGSEDFAARGGPGSVLAQAHNVVAIVAGGSYKPELPRQLTDFAELTKFLRDALGKDFVSTVNEATVKYRYDPSIGAGGTFGVNYPHYRESLPMFNYSTIYLHRAVRKRVVDLLLEHFWRPVKEETFDKAKTWTTCGEPCPAACKKIWRGKKLDYEPSNGLGPWIGVFKIELTAKLIDLADQLGFDAITIGHVIAWLLEATYRGLLQPQEIGLSEKPRFDPMLLNVDELAINAKLAEELLIHLVEERTEVLKIVARGIREAAKKLDDMFADRVKKLGMRFEDLVVYQPYGERWYMTPNYYWTPGLLLPLPVTGKYWTNYTSTFIEPEEFGKTVATRIIKEVEISNAGLCRFHRGWAEKVLPKLYEALGVKIDLDQYTKMLYQQIAEYNIKAGAKPRIIEGDRAKDVIVLLANELGVEEWSKKFASNRDATLREWIERTIKVVTSQLGLTEQWYKEL